MRGASVPAPELLRDDSEGRHLANGPGARVSVPLPPRARVVLPAGPAIDELTSVKTTVRDLPNCGHGPVAARPGDPLGVQLRGDPPEPLASRERLEDPNHYAGLIGVDRPLDVVPVRNVPISVDAPAGAVAALGFAQIASRVRARACSRSTSEANVVRESITLSSAFSTASGLPSS